MKKTPYNLLPIVPTIVAETVCATPYTGKEWSGGLPQADVDRIEAKRQLLTPTQVREFSDLCEVRCQRAYHLNASWFLRIAKAHNAPQQLAVWLTHWLASYLHNPEQLRRSV